MLHAGSIHCLFPGICEHFGWGNPNKLCGPVILGMGDTLAVLEKRSPCKHKAGAPEHKPPSVNGKPFHIKDHLTSLESQGLTVNRAEWKATLKIGHKPKGKPKTVNGVIVYPAPHFGRPA